MYFEPETGTLISGDVLWPSGMAVIFPELLQADGFDSAHDSLDRLRALRPSWVVPGHGPLLQHDDVDSAIRQARERLMAWQRSPDRHALHGARVLLKFHMMEVGQESLEQLQRWVRKAPLMREIHERWTHGIGFDVWVEQLMQQLIRRGALTVRDSMVFDS